MAGQYVSDSNHYYYGDVLFRYHHPFEKRTVERNKAFGQRADAAATVTERKAVTKETGVTGLSVFYRLHDLCGFDPIKDLVIDAMHALTLNLIRSEIEKTTELKDGRVPSVCPSDPGGKHKLGFWKSEEFSKLSLVAPYILHSQIPKEPYECFCLLTRIHQLVFSKELRTDAPCKILQTANN